MATVGVLPVAMAIIAIPIAMDLVAKDRQYDFYFFSFCFRENPIWEE